MRNKSCRFPYSAATLFNENINNDDMATEGGGDNHTTSPRTRGSSFFFLPLALRLETPPGSSPSPIMSYRHEWEISDQVTATIGGDLHAARRPVRGVVGCKLSARDGDWAMELSNREAVVLTPDIDLAKPLVSLVNSSKFSLSLPINVRIGTEWGEDGTTSQHVCDVGVKNKWVIGAFLASSLIFKTPQSVHVKRKEIGGVKFNVSGAIPVGLGAVVDANLSREGRRLVVSFTDVPTPVVRTSEKFRKRREA